MVNEEENTAFMGDIAVPAGSGRIQDGDLLCTLMHLEERISHNVEVSSKEAARAATDIKVKTGRNVPSESVYGMTGPAGVDSSATYRSDPAIETLGGTSRKANGAGRIDDTRPRRMRDTRASKPASRGRSAAPRPLETDQLFPGWSSGTGKESTNGANAPAAFGLGSVNQVPQITRPKEAASTHSPLDDVGTGVNEPTAFGLGQMKKSPPKPTTGMGSLDNMTSDAAPFHWSKTTPNLATGNGVASGDNHLVGLTGAAGTNSPIVTPGWSSDGRADNVYSSAYDVEEAMIPSPVRSRLDQLGTSNTVPDWSQSSAATTEPDVSPLSVNANGWPDWSQPVNAPEPEAAFPAPSITSPSAPPMNSNGWPDWSQPLQETTADPSPSFPAASELATVLNGLELEPMPIHMPETGTKSKGE